MPSSAPDAEALAGDAAESHAGGHAGQAGAGAGLDGVELAAAIGRLFRRMLDALSDGPALADPRRGYQRLAPSSASGKSRLTLSLEKIAWCTLATILIADVSSVPGRAMVASAATSIATLARELHEPEEALGLAHVAEPRARRREASARFVL